MNIRWVNHASFVVESGGVGLLCDPWLVGTAFDDSWALLSETRMGPDDFSSVTHLWLSHEHPDHFSPASLRSIPENDRARIVVLFQKTRDRRVVKFCESLGFAEVRELPTAQWVTLAPDFDVMCSPFRFDDSWLAVRTSDQLVLNVNDCLLDSDEDMSEIVAQIGGHPDVLATQFSFASWVGNADDVEAHRQAAREALDKLADQVRVMQPAYVIPFASFVWFCHEENSYMNPAMNTIGDAVERLAALDVVPVVLYPGDSWELGTAPPTKTAIERYDLDYAAVPARALARSERVDLADLREAGRRFGEKLIGHYGKAYRALSLVGWPAPTHIWLSDHERAVRLNVSRGITVSARHRDQCDVGMSSAALAYMLNNTWGGMTLIINGRFTKPAGGDFNRFMRYARNADATNHGKTVVMAATTKVASVVPFVSSLLGPLIGE